MQKDFDDWNNLKKELNSKNKLPTFKQREIWWCHLGLNVGDEENGKGDDYSRPILIVKKFNKNIFLGVPLTTKIKNNPYYQKIHFKNREQCAMLSQFKIIDCKRLMNKKGDLSRGCFDKVVKGISGLLNPQ